MEPRATVREELPARVDRILWLMPLGTASILLVVSSVTVAAFFWSGRLAGPRERGGAGPYRRAPARRVAVPTAGRLVFTWGVFQLVGVGPFGLLATAAAFEDGAYDGWRLTTTIAFCTLSTFGLGVALVRVAAARLREPEQRSGAARRTRVWLVAHSVMLPVAVIHTTLLCPALFVGAIGLWLGTLLMSDDEDAATLEGERWP